MSKELGIVCCYFNSCAYESRKENFLQFYKSIAARTSDICVVELAFGDADHVLPEEVNAIKVRSNSVLWQKEALLNIGIKKLLADGYESIAWFDADILFDNAMWYQDIIDTLRQYRICQAFGKVCKYKWKKVKNGEVYADRLYLHGSARYFKDTGMIYTKKGDSGFGWAARAEVLAECNLFDKGIIGGGDALIWYGMHHNTLNVAEACNTHPMFSYDFPDYRLSYVDWCKRWSKAVNGSVGYSYTSLQTMYHGSIRNKKYTNRYDILVEHEYDPATDIRYNDDGCIEWNTDKEEFHKHVTAYFQSRDEDDFLKGKENLKKKKEKKKWFFQKWIEDADRSVSEQLEKENIKLKAAKDSQDSEGA